MVSKWLGKEKTTPVDLPLSRLWGLHLAERGKQKVTADLSTRQNALTSLHQIRKRYWNEPCFLLVVLILLRLGYC